MTGLSDGYFPDIDVIHSDMNNPANRFNSKGQPADRPGKQITREEWKALSNVIGELFAETEKAISKHAAMCSPHEGAGVIREEFEELWEHVKADTGRSPAARKEALQLAAMAVRYIVDLIDGDNR